MSDPDSVLGVCPPPCDDTPLAIAGSIVTFLTFAYGILILVLYYYHVIVNGGDEAGELARELADKWEDAAELRQVSRQAVESRQANEILRDLDTKLMEKSDEVQTHLKTIGISAARDMVWIPNSTLSPAEFVRKQYRSSLRYRFLVDREKLRDDAKDLERKLNAFVKHAKSLFPGVLAPYNEYAFRVGMVDELDRVADVICLMADIIGRLLPLEDREPASEKLATAVQGLRLNRKR